MFNFKSKDPHNYHYTGIKIDTYDCLDQYLVANFFDCLKDKYNFEVSVELKDNILYIASNNRKTIEVKPSQFPVILVYNVENAELFSMSEEMFRQHYVPDEDILEDTINSNAYKMNMFIANFIDKFKQPLNITKIEVCCIGNFKNIKRSVENFPKIHYRCCYDDRIIFAGYMNTNIIFDISNSREDIRLVNISVHSNDKESCIIKYVP